MIASKTTAMILTLTTLTNVNPDIGVDENDFFPFPSEMFFLLYSYAHSIITHKVKSVRHYNIVMSFSCITVPFIGYYGIGIEIGSQLGSGLWGRGYSGICVTGYGG